MSKPTAAQIETLRLMVNGVPKSNGRNYRGPKFFESDVCTPYMGKTLHATGYVARVPGHPGRGSARREATICLTELGRIAVVCAHGA